MITEKIIKDAEHMVLLLRATAGIYDTRQVPEETVGKTESVTRLEMILSIADRIYREAKEELNTWEDLNNII